MLVADKLKELLSGASLLFNDGLPFKTKVEEDPALEAINWDGNQLTKGYQKFVRSLLQSGNSCHVIFALKTTGLPDCYRNGGANCQLNCPSSRPQLNDRQVFHLTLINGKAQHGAYLMKSIHTRSTGIHGKHPVFLVELHLGI